MTDRASLEQQLSDLRGRVHVPTAAPDFADQVLARVATARPRHEAVRPRPSRTRRAVVVIAAVLAAAVGAANISPAIADRLGLRGLRIELGGEDTPLGVELGAPLELGEPISLAEAKRRASFGLLTPRHLRLREPDEVWIDVSSGAVQVSFVYSAGDGVPEAPSTGGAALLLTQLEGGVFDGYAKKLIGEGTRIEAVVVNGGRGYFVDGDPHFLIYLDRFGEAREDRTRLAGNVLVWEQGDVTLRLEGALDRDTALAYARTIR